MAKAFGIIATTGNRYHVEGLQNYRSIAAITMLGRYRAIDFSISNMSNSGIDQIQVFVSKNPRSITEHLESGRYFNINSKRGRLQILFSEPQGNVIYDTDVTAYAENMEYIRRMDEKYVVIAPGYMIYTQNYDKLIEEHIKSKADITMLYQHVENAKDHFLNCDFLQLGKDREVLAVERNNGNAKDRNIFMDTYVMTKELFIDLVMSAQRISSVYTFSQIINQRLYELKLVAYPHRGYFSAITDFKSFYDANMALLDMEEAVNLFRNDWPIYTRTTNSAPTQYCRGAKVKRSMISNGCLIEGTVENSVIGRGCHIKKGAIVKDSVLLAYAQIGEDVVITNQVVDKWAKIEHTKAVLGNADTPGYIHRNDVL